MFGFLRRRSSALSFGGIIVLTLVSSAVTYAVKLGEVRASESQTFSLRARLVERHFEHVAQDLRRFKYRLATQFNVSSADNVTESPAEHGFGRFVGLDRVENAGTAVLRELNAVLGMDSRFRHLTQRSADLQRIYYRSDAGFIYAVPPASDERLEAFRRFAEATVWTGSGTQWLALPQPLVNTHARDPVLFAGELIRLYGATNGLLVARVSVDRLEPFLTAGESTGHSYLSYGSGRPGLRVLGGTEEPPRNIPALRRDIADGIWLTHSYSRAQPYTTAIRASILPWVILCITSGLAGLAVYCALRSEIRERSSAERRLREAYVEQEDLSSRLRNLASDLAILQHRERKRVAAVFHDDLQQLLVAIRIRMACPNDGDLEQASALIARAIESARNVREQLQPPGLYESGMSSALRWLADEIQREYSLRVSIEAPDPDYTKDLGDDLKSLLYEAARELLFNTAKHAGTDRAAIKLSAQGSRLVLLVEDEGKGFDPVALERESGVGLFSLRERFRAGGGDMWIRSAPGKGTTVCLTIPFA